MTDSFNPGFQVVHYEEGVDLPSSGTYFVVAGNGIFLHKDMGVLKGFVQVDGVDFLKDMDKKSNVRWDGPKIPYEWTSKIKKFFRLVVDKFHSEACTVLYHNAVTGQWKVVVPLQRVSHGSVGYKREALAHMGEFVPVGTIHSHADFNAFHSGTDVGDEETFDGLHLTFGHNNKDCISIAASVVMNGVRAQIDPLTVLEGVEYTPDGYKFPLEEAAWDAEPVKWLDNVSCGYAPVYLNTKSGDVEIEQGDHVTWSEDVGGKWRRTYGEGPFEVLSMNEDLAMGKVIVLKADVQGKLTFPVSFFEKVKETINV